MSHLQGDNIVNTFMPTTTPAPTQQGRMFLYVWSESTNPAECKFGERWVKPGDDASTSVAARVKESLGVRKDLMRSGVVTVDHIWDVSTYAAQVGRLRQHARMDDHVRTFVGHRKGTTGEVHMLSSDELILKVNQHLAQVGQPLPPARLSTLQCEIADQVVATFDAGHRVVLAELCARFGKTLWSGAVAHELETQVVVVASYVKTVFSSFAKDLTSFAQWSQYAHVDTQAVGWQDQINEALLQGRQVMAYLSMANGGQRQARIDFLFSLPVTRMLIVDEADFGSHTPRQAEPLKAAVQPTDQVLIMTGTNADRASRPWKFDKVVSVTYPELLVQKTASMIALAAGIAPHHVCPGLLNFEQDITRDTLMPSISLYQLDLSEPVMQSAATGELGDQMQLLPSWSKFAAHPQKSKGFFVRVLESVFLGKHGVDKANVDLQTMNWFGANRRRVAMMFVPHQTGIAAGALKAMGVIAQSALPAWRVIVLGGGDIRVAGQRVRNANAERTVKEQLEAANKANQSVLIISSQLAQRSFSIPELEELYLAYDEGQAGSTIQKISRVLTPGLSPHKVGKIISLSFDPNRDDKFDAMLLDAAFNIRQRHTNKSAAECMSEVLATVDIWRGSSHQATPVLKDDYLDQLMGRRAISRVIGSTADLTLLDAATIKELASGLVQYTRATPTASVPRGKTKQVTTTRMVTKSKKDLQQKLIQLARERLVGIVDNIDLLLAGSGCDQISEALVVVGKDPMLQAPLVEEFGVGWAVVQQLFDSGVIRQEWLELLHDRI